MRCEESPPYVTFILNFLSRSVSIDRHYDCNQFLDKSSVAPRVDAQASSTRTGIGGWFPHLDENGSIDQWKSPWFSLEITPEVPPWIYERGDRPALLVSTLEALAVLMALKLYYGNDPGNNVTSVTLVPTFTDNRGNGSALNKLMSTRLPFIGSLDGTFAFLKHRKLKALVEWTPRESNREADALANGCADGFNPELELKVDCENLQWSILPKALEVEKQAEEAYRTAKDGGHLPNRAKKERKKRLEDRLRTKDPW